MKAIGLAMTKTVGDSFLDYWDYVVRQWISYPCSCRKGSMCLHYYDARYNHSSFDVQIEDEQMTFFKHKSLKDKLCPAHLPEPYWGDPNNCSVVIVNYNPGGGSDMSPHTYKFTNGSPDFLPFPPKTMIEHVYRYSYSGLAKDFPIWKENLPCDKAWLESYGGRQWWLAKKEWIKHIVVDTIDLKTLIETFIEECPPFAIEFCGWHSAQWPNLLLDSKKDADLLASIKKHFAEPLLYAIEQSKTHLAVCIGSDFKPSIFGQCMQICNISACFEKALKSALPSNKVFPLGKNASFSYTSIKWQTKTVAIKGKSFEDGKLCVDVTINTVSKNGKKATETVTRFYRIYKILPNDTIDNKKDNKLKDSPSSDEFHHIVINTYAKGSNHHPAEHFSPFETQLITALKQMGLI